ncbi:MAG: methyltransferase domain-containing protein [Woeseia sp.]
MTTQLHEQRLEAVRAAVRDSRARTVLDLGCGDGDLLLQLVIEPQIEKIIGIDPSLEALLSLRIRLDTLSGRALAEVDLLHASMTEAGDRLRGYDCAVLLETIEHTEPGRLSILERSVFGTMRPTTVIVTTPNADYNALLGMPPGSFRHPDHRFEWGRPKFRRWAQGVATRNAYRVAFSDIAGQHPIHGGASQMSIFTLVM